MATKKTAAPKEFTVITDGDTLWMYELDLYTYTDAVKRAKVIAEEEFDDVFIVQIVGRIVSPESESERNYKVIK